MYRLFIITNLTEILNEYDQWWYNRTIQHFILENSSELKLASGEGSIHFGINIRNQVTLNKKTFVWEISNTWIYSMWCRLHHVFILSMPNQRLLTYIRTKRKNIDASNLFSISLLLVTQEVLLPHFLPLS